MDDLQPVSIVDPEDRELFVTIHTQAYLDDLSGSDVYFPTSSPVQLLSDGNEFYEAPLLLTPSSSSDVGPSRLDVDTNRAPNSVMETNLAALPDLHTASVSIAGAGAGAAIYPASLPSSSTSAVNTGVVAPQTSLSDNAARAQIDAYIRISLWFQAHALEPRVGERGVPVSALQLAKRGQSIWVCFVKRVRRKGTLVFRCAACGHDSDRLRRAVGHQRAKWGHKPFACPDPGW
jgi:hypothetical protein